MQRRFFSQHNAYYFVGSIILLAFMYFQCFVHPDKDFDVFIGASKLIWDGKTCYDVWIPVGGSFLLYFYSPLFAILITPLTFLPQYLYNVIWFVLNLWFLYRIIKVLYYYLDISGFDKRHRNVFLALVVIANLRFLVFNFDLGQMTIFLVFASLESIRLISDGRKIMGSALLAFAINIKLLPITLLLFYRAEYKSLLLVVFFFLLYLFLPSLFIGYDFNNFLIADWCSIMTTTVDNSLAEDLGRPGLSSLVLSLLHETEGKVTFSRNLFSLNIASANFVLNIVRGVLVLLTVYFLKWPPFKKSDGAVSNFYALSYIMLVTPLVFPHQNMYSFFYLLPAYSYLIYFAMKLFDLKRDIIDYSVPLKFKVAIAGIIMSFVFITLSSDGVIGRHYSDIAEHFHLIAIGTFMLIVSLAILNPDRIVEKPA